jgi:superfamily II RNA helicase
VNDELIATELLFENVLTDLEPAEIAALIASLIFEEKARKQLHLAIMFLCADFCAPARVDNDRTRRSPG